MRQGVERLLANLMTYPVLICGILAFVISIFFLVAKRKTMKTGIKVLLIILAIISGAIILFLAVTAFAFGNNHPIASPVP